MRERDIRYRFHHKTRLPEAPSGTEVIKFHGRPVVIPKGKEGEKIVEGIGLTPSQVDVVVKLERRRVVMSCHFGEERFFDDTNVSLDVKSPFGKLRKFTYEFFDASKLDERNN